MVYDSRLSCDCCGKRESVGCVRGVVNCRCETKTVGFIPVANICPDCKKCPVHCSCNGCDCGDIKLFGHNKDCEVRLNCRAKIQKENEEIDLIISKLN